jgi:broad specificity phosphatase PhoE
VVSEKRLRELAEAVEPRAAGALGGGALRLGQEGVTEVLLIRHAQMPESPDPGEDRPLTDVGGEQAGALAAFLASTPLHAVYSSPTLRTRETAEEVAKPHGLTVTIIDDLRDVEFYVPEGNTWEEFANEDDFKERTQRFQRERRWDVYAPFVEQRDGLRSRIRNVVDEVVGRHPGRRIALVSHGPTINAYLASLTQSSRDMIVRISLTGVSVVLAKDDRRVLHTVSSTAHFGTL